MNENSLIQSLNPSQQQAVLDFDHSLLVLAGAGSGKTRMLTNKIAYGIEQGIISPHSFLAVTFTNKAAGEMKSRISLLWQSTSKNLCRETGLYKRLHYLRYF
jgi:DNA helicase II / ATP-dependent DNA helicase PcrA